MFKLNQTNHNLYEITVRIISTEITNTTQYFIFIEDDADKIICVFEKET